MKTILGLLSVAIVSGCAVSPAISTSVQSLTTREASGEYNVPQIKIPKGHAVNLSFIPSGETIRQVRIDDRSRILVRFDAPLCSGDSQTNCSNSVGASVITLSQLAKPLRFDPNEKQSYRQNGDYRTTLTVVTTRGRQRALYTFELVTLNSSTTDIRTVQIVRSSTVAALPSPKISSVAQQLLQHPSAPIASATPVDEVAQIQNGIRIAGQRQLIGNPSSTWTNLQNFSSAIATRQVSISQAAQQNNVPLGIVDWLKTLHN